MTLYRLILGLLLCCGLATPIFAAQPDTTVVAPIDPARVAEQQVARRQALEQEKQAIANSRSELYSQVSAQPRQLETLKPEQINETLVAQAAVDTQSASIRKESLRTERDNVQSRISELRKTLSELEARKQLLKNPATNAGDTIADRPGQLQQVEQRIAQLHIDLELENLHLSNVLAQIEVAQMRYELALQWQKQVETAHRHLQEQKRLDTQAELVTRLQSDQSDLQNRANALKQRLSQERDKLSLAAWQRLDIELRTVDARINLLSLDRQLAESAAALAKLRDFLQKTTTDAIQIRQGFELAGELKAHLQRDRALLEQRLTLYEQQRKLIERREKSSGVDRRLRDEELQLVDELLGEVHPRIGQVEDQLLQLENLIPQLEADYHRQVRQDLFTHHPYPTTAEGWKQLITSVAAAFPTLFHQVRLSFDATFRALLDAPVWRLVVLVVLESLLIWGIIVARRRLNQSLQRRSAEEHTGSFIEQLIEIILLVIQDNVLIIGGAIGAVLFLWLAAVPQPGFGILITLILVSVGIRLPITVAWLLLAAPRLPIERRQLPLYRLLLCTLIGGAFWAILVTLANFSDVPEVAVNTFERLFMLYWLWIFIPTLLIRRWVIERLSVHYSERFWFTVLRFGSFLLPLSLLFGAVLGLVGYPQLAWLVAGGLLIFIGILLLWLLVYSLLNDLIIFLKNFALAHSGYGLLWTQDVISPMHRIANLALFIGAILTLFHAYGWTAESAVVIGLWKILEKPLISLGSLQITLWRIIVTITMLSLAIWLGQWIRAISYRWILSHISDLGVRHSLSVFTQYTVVLIGVLVILQLVGIDLTALAVFAGAVGVGIGLGMQGLANNFISGLLLLIERPLRSGDIVQVGTYLGEVTDIGMRALIVKTFDNESVIIPNSDVISNAFINWTHDDQIHRTIVLVGISYDADPHPAQKIMQEILDKHPAVLSDPEPLALLWNFADGSIVFRLQYYVDLSKDGLFKTKSEVLFLVWERLKAAEIRMPYPQRDLYIKTWPESEPPKAVAQLLKRE